MPIDGQQVMRVLGVLFLTSFMPLTAYSFFKFRLKQKDAEYRRILDKLGYTGDNAPAYIPTIAKEYTASDYIMPVLFATFMTFLGSMVLIMGPSLQGRPDLSLVLIGPKLAAMKFDVPGLGTKFQTMLIIAMAFSGAYVWSIQNVFRRLATVDLPPGAYYGVAVRMLFSIFIALMLYYLLMSDTQVSFIQNALPVTAFLAGMFPQRALQYIQERVQFTSHRQSEGRSDPLPLSMIEGIELFQRVRLAELGIDNAQNLAQANGIELLLRTPFNPRVLWDWIGQARLYLYFKEDVNKLRMAGVRTIFEFKKLGRDEKVLSALAKSSGISIERLGVVAGLVHDDADVQKLQEGASRLLGWDVVPSA